MDKIKLSAPGVPDKQLTIEHAQALLDYQKAHKQDLWTVTDENYHVVNGKIGRKPSPNNGPNTEE